jgi:YHS domain-containing protein
MTFSFLACIRGLIAGLALATLSLGAVALSTVPAEAAERPIYVGLGSNVAVQGFDPVAYFSEGKPVKGDAKITLTHNGAEFRFASAANRDAFKANPAKYAPQYGGYCAWAVSQGYTAKGDAQHWKIVGGKLYLNYNADVQSKWEKNVPGFIASADKNWPSVLK